MPSQPTLVETALKAVVSLYRTAGRPEVLENNRFEADIVANEQIINAITTCEKLDNPFGRFEELLVDNSEYIDGQDILNGQQLQLCWALSTSGELPFYRSFEHLINTRKTLFKGEMPETYYIANEDLLVDQNHSVEKSLRLKSICQLIKYLSQIAHYHDEKSHADTFRLVFVINDTSKNGYHPVVLETKYTESELDGSELNLATLKEIVVAESNAESHAQEKTSMFRLCLAEMVESTPNEKNTFSHILDNWEELLKRYKQSFDIYLSGFSFNKVRNELAKAEVEVANSLSKVLSDITGKLFSIPVSFAALLTMKKLESIEENVLFVIGTLIVSLIISGLVRSQLLLKRNIDSSSKMIFSQLNQKKEEYPEELQKCLEDAKYTISKQSRLLGITLHGARIVGWSISFTAILLFVIKFWE
ncbi:hypothetical protein ACU6RQ_10755 [Zobellella denitrificans]